MGVPIQTQSIAAWCIELDGYLKDETLSPEDRAEITGIKKAMERLGYKNREPMDHAAFKTFPGAWDGA